MSTDLKLDNTRFHDHEIVSPFDKIRRFRLDGTEYWTARDMMGPLGYEQWRRMHDAVERAKISCNAMGHNISDHFAGAGKMISTGKGANRQVDDVELTRYACSLVAMNGDPRKPQVAAAQQYFAVMTRVAELAAVAPARDDRRLTAVESAQSDAANHLREIEDTIDRLTRRLTLVDAKASYAEQAVTGTSGFRTIHSWAKQRGVHLTSRQSWAEGEICKSMSATARVPVGSCPRADGRAVPIFSTHVLELWLVGYHRRQNERLSLFSE